MFAMYSLWQGRFVITNHPDRVGCIPWEFHLYEPSGSYWMIPGTVHPEN